MSKTIVVAEIAKGDIFSETSHYKVEEVKPSTVSFRHQSTQSLVELSHKYVEDLLQTADQFQSEKKVGKEDKKDGTPGIRTIFEGIGAGKVFTVAYLKQDSPKTRTAIKAEKDAIIEQADKIIKSKKKGVRDELVALLNKALDNPVSAIVPGEERILRGYKIQFVSRDGRYDCMDMDLPAGPSAIRPVNINTIKFVVVDGIKYTVA